MSQIFNKVNVATGKRSTFDLSHNQVTSTDFGKLIPIQVQECLPNDYYTIKPQVFIRLAPLASPTFGTIRARVHTFFVPNRILWKGWDNWIANTSSATPPYFSTTNIHQLLTRDPAYQGYIQSEFDVSRGRYTGLISNMGINPDNFTGLVSQGFNVNALPFLAYQRIWFDYFRNSDNSAYSESWFDTFTNGGSLSAYLNDLMYLRVACYKKDYITTAKVNPQQGSAGAGVGVSGIDTLSNSLGVLAVSNNASQLRATNTNTSGLTINPSLSSSGNAFTIAALRAANSLQKYLERNNYVGNRTISRILAHFGIEPSAERLNRAEYLGGDSFNVQIADVTSTSNTATSGSTFSGGLGSQAGKGVGAGSINEIKYHCKEHGFIISLLSIMPDTGYYQNLHRMWRRGFLGDNQFDYFTDEFENLSYQPLLNSEVFVPGTGVSYSSYNPDGVFGFIPRYADYKFKNDVLAGDFVARGTSSGANSYHLFRNMVFDENSPLDITSLRISGLYNHYENYDRIFQVTDNSLDHFYCDIHVDTKAERQMSGFVDPTLDVNNEESGEKVTIPYGGIRL